MHRSSPYHLVLHPTCRSAAVSAPRASKAGGYSRRPFAPASWSSIAVVVHQLSYTIKRLNTSSEPPKAVKDSLIRPLKPADTCTNVPHVRPKHSLIGLIIAPGQRIRPRHRHTVAGLGMCSPSRCDQSVCSRRCLSSIGLREYLPMLDNRDGPLAAPAVAQSLRTGRSANARSLPGEPSAEVLAVRGPIPV